jgi:hypothetical protein
MNDIRRKLEVLAEDIIFDDVLQKCNRYAFSYMPNENLDSKFSAHGTISTHETFILTIYKKSSCGADE